MQQWSEVRHPLAALTGDSGQAEALYPDFPRSSPIYAVIDRSKKRRRATSEECKEPEPERADPPGIRRPGAPGDSGEESGGDTVTARTHTTSSLDRWVQGPTVNTALSSGW